MVHIQMEQIRLHRLDLIEFGEVEEILEFVEFRIDGHETVAEEDLLRQIARSDVARSACCLDVALEHHNDLVVDVLESVRRRRCRLRHC